MVLYCFSLVKYSLLVFCTIKTSSLLYYFYIIKHLKSKQI
nr:MAG TPA: hypothetical protein [Herelleviridae sp.]